MRLPVGASFTSTNAPATISSGAVIFAAPQLVQRSAAPAEEAKVEPATNAWGKQIKPPSMILDENVNGFKSQKKGKNNNKGRYKKVCN